jgi:hypothetical protein
MTTRIDREIMVTSDNQNPNIFNVKFPETIAILPNTEVALIKGKCIKSASINIDSSNDTFTILVGQYDMDTINTGTESSCAFFPPQHITLKHGSWTTGIQRFNNIVDNLVESLNSQFRHFNWKWAVNESVIPATGIYPSVVNINGIYPYLCNHVPGGINWKSGYSNENNPESVSIVPAVPNTTPSYNIIETGNNKNFFLTSQGRAPMPYSFNILDTPNPAHPKVWHEFVLDRTIHEPQTVKIFGGLCFKSQEDYKKTESYDPDKDWCVCPLNEDGSVDLTSPENFIDRTIFGWELMSDGKIFIKIRDLNEDGTIADTYLLNQYSGYALAGPTTTAYIEIRPKIGGDGINKTIYTIDWVINGNVLGIPTIIPAKYLEHDYIHCFCGAYLNKDFQITFLGLTEEEYIISSTQSLGTFDKANALGNMNPVLYFDKIRPNHELQIFPVTKVDYNFYRNFLIKNNCQIFVPITYQPLATDPSYLEGYYWINGAVTDAQDPLILTINSNVELSDFHICLDNLPINEFSCNGQIGNTSSRIYSHYESGNNQEIIIEPHNIIYHKLHNKHVIMLNNLRIRITDNDNKIFQQLSNTTLLNLHFRTNPFTLLQSITGTNSTKGSRLEVINNSEGFEQLSESVF